jgi:integrase
MAGRHPITDRAVRALKPKATVYRVRDTERGFHVVVAPSGARSFALSYTSPETGRRTNATIGAYPAVSLLDARETARKWREMIRQGEDPALALKRRLEAEKRTREAEEEARRQEESLGTIEDLFRIYIADLEADGKRAAAQVRQIYSKDVAPYGKRKTLDADLILDIVAGVQRRGSLIMANRTRTYLLAAVRFGRIIQRKPRWRGIAPAFDLQPIDGAEIERPLQIEPVGRRFLSPDELVAVWNADVSIWARSAIRLLLSTGQRVEEVLGAGWAEFDEEAWTIPASRRKQRHKVKVDHVVPLTEFHQRVLEDLPRRGELLFPGRKGSLTYHWLHQALPDVGIPKWTARDCRRTFKTLGARAGISLDDRNRLQGHALSDVGSKHYDAHDYLDEKRRAMERWTRYLQTLLAGEAKVVPIRAAR